MAALLLVIVNTIRVGADGAAGSAGCGGQAFAAQLQLYMHRSPPPPPPLPQQSGEGSCSSNISGGAAAVPAAALAAQLAEQQAALVAQLEALRAPPPAAAEPGQTDVHAKQQEIQAALANCWQVRNSCHGERSSFCVLIDSISKCNNLDPLLAVPGGSNGNVPLY